MEEDKVDNIMEYLENLNQRISKIEEKFSKQGDIPQKLRNIIKEESFREFFIKYNPKKDTDKTLIIILYLESKGVENITSKEIASGFKEIRENLPANIADKIQMLHKRGLITPKNELDRFRSWEITKSGLEYLGGLINGIKKD